MRYQRELTVILTCNLERYPANKIEFLDMSEDMEGRNKMFFVCPVYGNEEPSLVYG